MAGRSRFLQSRLEPEKAFFRTNGRGRVSRGMGDKDEECSSLPGGLFQQGYGEPRPKQETKGFP